MMRCETWTRTLVRQLSGSVRCMAVRDSDSELQTTRTIIIKLIKAALQYYAQLIPSLLLLPSTRSFRYMAIYKGKTDHVLAAKVVLVTPQT
jgi:hypothetical protein